MGKHKKYFIIVLLSCLLIALLVLFFLFLQNKNRIVFYVDGKPSEKLDKIVEYHNAIDYSVQAIKLSAKQDNKDITKKIKVDKVNINQLKTYTITYRIEDAIFTYRLKVVDKTKPVITGKNEVEIQQDSTFDSAICEVKASDNFDTIQDNQIKVSGHVDTSKPGHYPVTFEVSDSSKNKATFVCNVKVKEKEVIVVDTNPSNQNNHSTRNVVSNPNDITVLVNKQNALPDGWAPSDLVAIGGNHYLRAEAANQLLALQSAIATEGIPFRVVSSYRSQSYQANLYQSYYQSDPTNAPFYSALPRTSEHELGLAIDISYDANLHNDLQNSSVGVWMAQHAHQYGFVLRYDFNKTNLTGYMYEPWHYRYVGVPLATQLKNSNIVLEEYY